MLGVLLFAVMGLYIRRLRNRVRVLEARLGDCLTDLESLHKPFKPIIKNDLTWVGSTIKPTKVKKTRKRKPRLIDDMDLDGLPTDDV